MDNNNPIDNARKDFDGWTIYNMEPIVENIDFPNYDEDEDIETDSLNDCAD